MAALNDATIVHVDLKERGYDIEIGTGNLERIGPWAASLVTGRHAVVVTDTNVEQPHATAVAKSLAEEDFDVDLVVIEPGEPSKSIDTADIVWQKLLQLKANRQTLIVAAGGGVVGDLAGFIAATYTRGVRLMQFPTTLLSQVDSSVGGKVGVNLPGAKNMVGAFWQPIAVLIDTRVLATLPAREYRAGLAEVVKYGVILDADFFHYLESHVAELNERDDDVLKFVIARCCRLKADVVEADERETSGLRAVLNYGHTFAHAIEAVTGYGKYLHGEAVSIGMQCASRLAEGLHRVDAHLTQRQHDLLTALGLPVAVPELDHDELIAAMQHDKKTEGGRLRFVLPTRLGQVNLVPDVEPALVRAALFC
jgi:3-dehydroquinate synthase